MSSIDELIAQAEGNKKPKSLDDLINEVEKPNPVNTQSSQKVFRDGWEVQKITDEDRKLFAANPTVKLAANPPSSAPPDEPWNKKYGNDIMEVIPNVIIKNNKKLWNRLSEQNVPYHTLYKIINSVMPEDLMEFRQDAFVGGMMGSAFPMMEKGIQSILNKFSKTIENKSPEVVEKIADNFVMEEAEKFKNSPNGQKAIQEALDFLNNTQQKFNKPFERTTFKNTIDEISNLPKVEPIKLESGIFSKEYPSQKVVWRTGAEGKPERPKSLLSTQTIRGKNEIFKNPEYLNDRYKGMYESIKKSGYGMTHDDALKELSKTLSRSNKRLVTIEDLFDKNKIPDNISIDNILPSSNKKVSQVDKYARPSSLNMEKYPEKSIKNIREEVQILDPHRPITNEEIIEAAKDAQVLKKGVSREEMLATAAQMKKTKYVIATAAKEKGFSKDYLDELQALSSHTTNFGVQLNALKLNAEELTSKDYIAEKLTKFGVNVNELVKKSEGLDWNNKKDVVDFYRSYVKPKWSEIIDEIRYINMLSSPKTHEVNMSTNLTQALITRPLGRTFSAIADPVVSKLTGKEREFYLKQIPAYYRGAIGSTKQAFREALDVFIKGAPIEKVESGNIPIGGGGKFFMPKSLKDVGDNIKTAVIKSTKPFQTIPRALEAGDRFGRTIFEAGEAAALKKGGMGNAEAKKKAVDKAKEFLFRKELDPKNETGQGKLLSGMDQLASYVLKARKIPGFKWITPFIKTPNAMFKSGLEHSGLFTPLTMIGNKNKTEQLGKMMVGTSMMGLGAWAAFEDKTTWAVPKNEREKAAFFAEGKVPYSIELVKGHPISYSKLGPLAFPLAIPAAVKHYFKDNPKAATDNVLEKTEKAIAGIAEFFTDQNFVEQYAKIIDVLNGGEDMAKRAVDTLVSPVTQMIPVSGLQKWVNNFIDDIYRNPEKDIDVGMIRDKFYQNVIGLSKNIKPYLNPEKEPSKKANPVLNNLLPVQIGTINKEFKGEYAESLNASRRLALRSEKSKTYNDIIDKINPEYQDEIITAMEDLPDEDQKKFMKDVSKLIRTTGVPKGYWYEMVKGLPANIGAMIFYDRYSKSSPEVQEQMMQGAMPYKLLTGSFNREFIKLQMKEYE